MDSLTQQAELALNDLDNHVLWMASKGFAHVDQSLRSELMGEIPYLKAGLRSTTKQEALTHYDAFVNRVKYAYQHNALLPQEASDAA